MRVQAFDDYMNSYNNINVFLSRYIDFELNRYVEIDIPFTMQTSDISHQALRIILKKVVKEAAGDELIAMGNSSVNVKWKNMPRIPLEDSFVSSDGMFAISASEGVEIMGSLGIGVRMKIEDEELFENKFKRSIINTLRGKKRQSVDGQINMLVLLLPQGNLQTEAMVKLIGSIIADDIFIKDDYKWLSIVLIYQPVRNFLKGEQSMDFMIINPNAKRPATEDLVGMLKGEKQFYWWKYEFGRTEQSQ